MARRVDATLFYLSVVTLLELEVGVLRIERRDVPQGARLRNWMQNHVLPGFFNRILPTDDTIALCAAALHVPNPQPERDAFIAVTALVHGMTVITGNTVDFKAFGVPLVNPWNESQT